MPMQNRKDLLQAHRLMTQRAALALLCGEPDSPNQPLRRRNTATISGILAGVIAVAVFGVLGLLSPGTVSGLTNPGTLAIDKDTGTAFVPCNGAELCPAVNFASALLALNTQRVQRVDVTQGALSHYRIGPAIGIQGLPPDLPTGANLVKGPWSVCAAQGVSTLVGGRAVGGIPLSANQAALATTVQGGGQGAFWLLWNGQRLQIQPQVAETLFGGQGNLPVVPTAWLDAIPQGPNFAAPKIDGERRDVTGPGGQAVVGQVFVAPSATGLQSYVLEASGRLTSISPVQADLLERVQGLPKPRQISASEAASDLSGASLPSNGLPTQVPRVSSMASPLCVTYESGLRSRITTGGTLPSGAARAVGSQGSGSQSGTARVGGGIDHVWLPPDHGALVGVAPDVNQPSAVTSWFLVTGATRYALKSKAVASVLGYDLTSDQTVLPASVAELLPQGPVLDPEAATAQSVG